MARILIKLLAVAAATALVVFVGAYVVGARMKPDYRGRVEIELAAAPEVVYAALEDYANSPHGGDAVLEVRPLLAGPEAASLGVARASYAEAGLVAWSEDLGRTQVTVRTVEAVAPLRLVREMQDDVLPMSARWELELLPTARGTKVVLRHSGSIEDGPWQVPLVRLMAKGFGQADRGPQRFLESLAERLGVVAVSPSATS